MKKIKKTTSLKKNKLSNARDKNQNQEMEMQWKFFAEYYASDEECFGHGGKAYAKAYGFKFNRDDPRELRKCYNGGDRLLHEPQVIVYINELLEEKGLNDNFVDKQLLFLITQFDDKNAKIAAIKEYNKLRQRIIERIRPEGEVEQVKSLLYKEVLGKMKTMSSDEMTSLLQEVITSSL